VLIVDSFTHTLSSAFGAYRVRLLECLQLVGESVEVRFDSIGYFPQRDRYTFHLAITNEASLAALRHVFGVIADAIPEVKPKFPKFVPHLTLVSVRDCSSPRVADNMSHRRLSAARRISRKHV
jgi:2'-5' RNA ligase